MYNKLLPFVTVVACLGLPAAARAQNTVSFVAQTYSAKSTDGKATTPDHS